MATIETQGFTLDNSGKRIVVDPITRIEGHLRIEVNVDDKNGIRNAVSTGTMWRGLEVILKGRDPRDAWAFVERICGVCTGVHALASVRSVEDALGRPVEIRYHATNDEIAATLAGPDPGIDVAFVSGDKPQLTIGEYDGEQATLIFGGSDGRGEKTGVYAPGIRANASAQYVGLVQRARVPTGSATVQYLLPHNDGGACVASMERPLKLKADQEVLVKAGGALQLKLDAGAEQETVQVALSLTTAAGDRVTGSAGEEEQAGKIEVLGPDGKVLATGEAGFG